MRADMHKVVVERERHGSTRKSRKWGQRLTFIPDADYDGQPTFVSSARGRQYGCDSKGFSDVLGPLKGFLRSNLGRPWDKVFSELRQGLDVRKVTGRHIFDHLESMVEKECSIGADQELCVFPRGHEVSGFYVHPGTKLLCFTPPPSKRERKKQRLIQQQINELRIDETNSFTLMGGQWYFVTYEIVEVGRHDRTPNVWDVVQRKRVHLTWGRNRVAVKKRQCDRNEIKRIRQRIVQWRKCVQNM